MAGLGFLPKPPGRRAGQAAPRQGGHQATQAATVGAAASSASAGGPRGHAPRGPGSVSCTSRASSWIRGPARAGGSHLLRQATRETLQVTTRAERHRADDRDPRS